MTLFGLLLEFPMYLYVYFNSTLSVTVADLNHFVNYITETAS